MVRRTEEGAWKWALRDFLREAARPRKIQHRQNLDFQILIAPQFHLRAFRVPANSSRRAKKQRSPLRAQKKTLPPRTARIPNSQHFASM